MVLGQLLVACRRCGLARIVDIDLQNMNIFPELLFDHLDALAKSDSFLVRAAVAKHIAGFALTSLRFLDKASAVRRSYDTNTNNNSNNNSKSTTYDKEYDYYQMRVTDIVMQLITDNTGHPAGNAVKETLIRSDIGSLCRFLSRQKTSEFLLPHMITILNEKTDWSVRAAFFDALCPVLACVGWESVEIVKSLLEQGLRDSEEFVIERTIVALSRMALMGLLDRMQICHFLSVHIAPFLCHPSLRIRHAAVRFITSVCKQNKSQQQTTQPAPSDNNTQTPHIWVR